MVNGSHVAGNPIEDQLRYLLLGIAYPKADNRFRAEDSSSFRLDHKMTAAVPEEQTDALISSD